MSGLHRKWRKLAAYAIAWLPFGVVRRWLLAGLFGADIHPTARIAWGVIIAVQHFRCGKGVVIRRGNSFIGPFDVELADQVFIGRWNRFECGEAVADASQAHMGYARKLSVGQAALINDSHIFDVVGEVRIGAGTWVAGYQSHFLTHGASAVERDIVIGERCYLGSAVRFVPGSGVGDGCMVGMGAVVTKRMAVTNAVIGGVPAKVLRERAEGEYRFERYW